MSRFCPNCSNDSFREHSWGNEHNDIMKSQWRCDYCDYESDIEIWDNDETFYQDEEAVNDSPDAQEDDLNTLPF